MIYMIFVESISEISVLKQASGENKGIRRKVGVKGGNITVGDGWLKGRKAQ